MKASTASFSSQMEAAGGGQGKVGDDLPANAFVEAKSYLLLEVEVMNPLVAKRPASAIAKR